MAKLDGSHTSQIGASGLRPTRRRGASGSIAIGRMMLRTTRPAGGALAVTGSPARALVVVNWSEARSLSAEPGVSAGSTGRGAPGGGVTGGPTVGGGVLARNEAMSRRVWRVP